MTWVLPAKVLSPWLPACLTHCGAHTSSPRLNTTQSCTGRASGGGQHACWAPLTGNWELISGSCSGCFPLSTCPTVVRMAAAQPGPLEMATQADMEAALLDGLIGTHARTSPHTRCRACVHCVFASRGACGLAGGRVCRAKPLRLARAVTPGTGTNATCSAPPCGMWCGLRAVLDAPGAHGVFVRA